MRSAKPSNIKAKTAFNAAAVGSGPEPGGGSNEAIQPAQSSQANTTNAQPKAKAKLRVNARRGAARLSN
jgi:hypothetical protein